MKIKIYYFNQLFLGKIGKIFYMKYRRARFIQLFLGEISKIFYIKFFLNLFNITFKKS